MNGMLGNKGKEEQAQAFSNMIFASAFTALTYALYGGGEDDEDSMLSNRGPQNYTKAHLYSQYENPVSLKMFGMDIPLDRFSPMSDGAALNMAVIDAWRAFMLTGNIEQGLDKYANAMAHTVIGKAWMIGAADLIAALGEDETRDKVKAVGGVVQNIGVSMLVPSAVSQFGNWTDDYDRAAVGFQEKLMKRVPFVRENLAPAMNYAGDEIKPKAMVPWPVPRKQDALAKELLKLGINLEKDPTVLKRIREHWNKEFEAPDNKEDRMSFAGFKAESLGKRADMVDMALAKAESQGKTQDEKRDAVAQAKTKWTSWLKKELLKEGFTEEDIKEAMTPDQLRKLREYEDAEAAAEAAEAARLAAQAVEDELAEVGD
jgi:hypothetical protein